MKLFSLGLTKEQQIWGVVNKAPGQGDGCQ
jgi:hypothetical protein